jgi:hypothetical protein
MIVDERYTVLKAEIKRFVEIYSESHPWSYSSEIEDCFLAGFLYCQEYHDVYYLDCINPGYEILIDEIQKRDRT